MLGLDVLVGVEVWVPFVRSVVSHLQVGETLPRVRHHADFAPQIFIRCCIERFREGVLASDGQRGAHRDSTAITMSPNLDVLRGIDRSAA